jgi:hypothetical protein
LNNRSFTLFIKVYMHTHTTHEDVGLVSHRFLLLNGGTFK